MRKTKAAPRAKAAEKSSKTEAVSGGQSNRVAFRVIWNSDRNAYQVHGDDGQIHAFSPEKQKMITVAIRKAKRAGKLGMEAVVYVQQEDYSFKVEWSS